MSRLAGMAVVGFFAAAAPARADIALLANGTTFKVTGQRAQEDGLQDVLGVGRIAGDAKRCPKNCLGMAGVEFVEPRRRGGGRHAADRKLVDVHAGCGHLPALTSYDARVGLLLHGTPFIL